MKVSRVQTLMMWMISLGLPACDAGDARDAGDRQTRVNARKVTVAAVQSKPATVEDSYECRVDSEGIVFVRSPVEGRVAAILVKEGQTVKRGDPLFEVEPDGDELKSPAKDRDRLVSIEAPCNGPVLGFRGPGPGDPVGKGTQVLTLGDDGAMRVRFDVPEKLYLASINERGEDWKSRDLELILADRSNYPHVGRIVDFPAGRSEKGAGYLRAVAEFPNPDGTLSPGSDRRKIVEEAGREGRHPPHPSAGNVRGPLLMEAIRLHRRQGSCRASARDRH